MRSQPPELAKVPSNLIVSVVLKLLLEFILPVAIILEGPLFPPAFIVIPGLDVPDMADD
jgi:hypothetical protein